MNCGRSPVDIQYDRVTDPFRVPLVPSDRLEIENMSIHMHMNICHVHFRYGLYYSDNGNNYSYCDNKSDTTAGTSDEQD